MRVTLKKIDVGREEYTHIREKILSTYKKNGKIKDLSDAIEKISQDVLWKDRSIYVEVDMKRINKIVNSNTSNYQKNAALAVEFKKIFSTVGQDLPVNLLYDPLLWTYLNLTIFKDNIYKMYFKNVKAKDEEYDEDKVERYYFNEVSLAKLDRSGFRYNWYMGEILDSINNMERCQTAFEFIDTVKAVGERTLSNNYNILKAYIDAIIVNNKDPKFKDKELRKVIPAHINCCAAVLMFDAYEYSELVNIIAEEQKKIINMYSQ